MTIMPKVQGIFFHVYQIRGPMHVSVLIRMYKSANIAFLRVFRMSTGLRCAEAGEKAETRSGACR